MVAKAPGNEKGRVIPMKLQIATKIRKFGIKRMISIALCMCMILHNIVIHEFLNNNQIVPLKSNVTEENLEDNRMNDESEHLLSQNERTITSVRSHSIYSQIVPKPSVEVENAVIEE